MILPNYLKATPWDEKVFGFPTYDLLEVSDKIFSDLKKVPGHFTYKCSDLSANQKLQQNGFYFCGTLVEPFISTEKIVLFYPNESTHKLSIRAGEKSDFPELLSLASEPIPFGRFHRDPNILQSLANARYLNWFKQLWSEGTIFTLIAENEVAGYIATKSNSLVLHVIAEKFRSKGLAKYFWSMVCEKLISDNHSEIVSSIAADNLAVVNLYASLGFKFRNPQHCFHKFNSSAPK